MSDERSALSASDARRLGDVELAVEAFIDVLNVNRDDFEKSRARILEDRANAVAVATNVAAVDQRPVTVNNIVDELMDRMRKGENVTVPTMPVPEPAPTNVPDTTPTVDPFSQPSRAGGV